MSKTDPDELKRKGDSTGQSGSYGLAARFGVLALLIAIELPFLAFLYDPVSINTAPAWLAVRVVLREAVPVTLFFLAALGVLVAPQRRRIANLWAASAAGHRWRAPLAVNLLLFAALAGLTPIFNRYGGEAPPWGLFALWCVAIGAAYVALAAALAPASFWRRFIVDERPLLAIAGGAAIIIESAALLSRQSWSFLSEATFQVSARLLSLYETNVTIIPENRVIGVDGFDVNIAAACSGYEGIGLVVTFLAIYFWVFRSVLKFPNVLLMLPAGVAAIWILNSVRIALLVSIGAHVSPEIAISGFHSQAGWMMFLIVTIAMMVMTHRIAFFHNFERPVENIAPSPAASQAAALLAPFLAMTAATIIGAAFSGEGYWAYGLRVAAILLALTAFWRFYKTLDWRIGLSPILIGVVVGAVWIATDPGKGSDSALGDWLGALPAALMILWLVLRIFGTVILAPIAEELAFRGYLHRKLIAEKFEHVAAGAFSWAALIVSSALFGVLHDRWLSGALAGAMFALALYRSGKITGAIAAHLTANAIIAFWAVMFGQWSLL
ncbi:exosortase E/protease, VPEID-CTERM system [Hyphococcus sp.]|uniref:exosortase E/protease, VPEID-CTERM system n=1 Tax=Hyphococcus sp. TaxID=2038636 RepID=UPI002088805D|nr:MAG: hypothetical protein DHS20C04_25640 [Marinicaulis sp.]